ncbi:MAG: MarR family transcriptional regulator [Muribaculaceae bacterium]|nr:MarR family transcriptional regulator [Anaeroplasma bactoclasticum]MCM1296266.1 MarR family transcriptional regulator [Muribaculaceae bacterium]MCM1556384.1 MarR family transcriptional regulator [Anaeroplasma bactoclasticum]
MTLISEQRREINKRTSENDCLYHLLAQKYNLSDNVFYILYYLYEEKDGTVSQSDLCEYWLYSKQTINSSITVMKNKGWIELVTVPNTRNRKNIVLTDEGKAFCQKAIGEIIALEEKVYARFSDEERTTFIAFFRRLNLYMEEECKK